MLATSAFASSCDTALVTLVNCASASTALARSILSRAISAVCAATCASNASVVISKRLCTR